MLGDLYGPNSLYIPDQVVLMAMLVNTAKLLMFTSPSSFAHLDGTLNNVIFSPSKLFGIFKPVCIISFPHRIIKSVSCYFRNLINSRFF